VKELIEKNTELVNIFSKSSRDEQKKALQNSVNTYLEAIEAQVGDLKKVGQNALIIGGIVVAAYALTELLLPQTQEEEKNDFLPIQKKNEEEESFIGSALRGMATTVILTVARQKLVDLIEHLTAKNASADS
jgi:hypothetical protein